MTLADLLSIIASIPTPVFISTLVIAVGSYQLGSFFRGIRDEEIARLREIAAGNRGFAQGIEAAFRSEAQDHLYDGRN